LNPPVTARLDDVGAARFKTLRCRRGKSGDDAFLPYLGARAGEVRWAKVTGALQVRYNDAFAFARAIPLPAQLRDSRRHSAGKAWKYCAVRGVNLQ
jgi:hypothetical protein